MAPIILHRLGMGKGIEDLITAKQDIGAWSDYDPDEVHRVGKFLNYSMRNGYFFNSDQKDQIISLTRIDGTITKNGGMCSDGTSHIGTKLSLKDENEKVAAHIIQFDSPGGAVDGTPELGSIIANLSKPVIAFVDNMAASAAYWLASQSSYIVTNALNYTQVGSIGTLCMMVDQQGWLKKEGLKVSIMRAKESVDKARLNGMEPWPEESLAELQEELNAINADFIGAVKSGRNGKLSTILSEDIFTGKMYSQQDALRLGMIDQIGTIETAIQAANSIARNKKSTILK